MKKIMLLLVGIMIAGVMVSGCGQKQEAAENAPAVEQAAPAAGDQAVPAAGENTPAATQAAPVAPAQ